MAIATDQANIGINIGTNIGNSSSTVHFCLQGRFLSFLPGEKSPYQRISVEVIQPQVESQAQQSQAQQSQAQPILLSKDLRRMMYRYLIPQDWIRVVGKQIVNRHSGQLEWQATEISKLSAAPQIKPIEPSKLEPSKLEPSIASSQSVQVLVCHGSSCRQRGSSAVSGAIAQAFPTTHPSQNTITVRAIGCLKRCKAGPHLVTIPGGSYSQVTCESGIAIVQKIVQDKQLKK